MSPLSKPQQESLFGCLFGAVTLSGLAGILLLFRAGVFSEEGGAHRANVGEPLRLVAKRGEKVRWAVPGTDARTRALSKLGLEDRWRSIGGRWNAWDHEFSLTLAEAASGREHSIKPNLHGELLGWSDRIGSEADQDVWVEGSIKVPLFPGTNGMTMVGTLKGPVLLPQRSGPGAFAEVRRDLEVPVELTVLPVSSARRTLAEERSRRWRHFYAGCGSFLILAALFIVFLERMPKP